MKSFDKIQKELDNLEQIINQAQNIVERFRKFYREEKTKLENFPLKQVFEECIKITKPKWEHEALKRGAKINIVFERCEDLVVKSNPADLREVLTNLIFNAVEAMPKGGKIIFSVYRDGLFGVVEIQDTGTGIPPEIQEHIFEPFFTTKEEGSGLGLAICYRLIQTLGGEISFQSSPEEGTTFFIKLPLATA